MSMPPALTTTPGVTECPSVPRRPLGLLPLLVSRVCERSTLPTVEVGSLTPVRSMFDYDEATAIDLDEVPRLPR